MDEKRKADKTPWRDVNDLIAKLKAAPLTPVERLKLLSFKVRFEITNAIQSFACFAMRHNPFRRGEND